MSCPRIALHIRVLIVLRVPHDIELASDNQGSYEAADNYTTRSLPGRPFEPARRPQNIGPYKIPVLKFH